MKINKITNYNYKGNSISFERFILSVPYHSILSKNKIIELTLIKPNLKLNSSILKQKSRAKITNKRIKFNRININNGNLLLRDKNFIIKSLDLNVKSNISDNITYLKVYSNHLNLKFRLLKKWFELSGSFKSRIKLQKNNIRIINFKWETKNLIINMNGNIKNNQFFINIYSQGDISELLYPLLTKFSPKGNSYTNIKIFKDKNNVLKVSSKININTANIENVKFNDFKTEIKWNSKTKSVFINSRYKNSINNKYALITAINKDKKFNINISNIEADKIIKLIKIEKDAPLKNIIQSGKIEIIKDNLNAVLKTIRNNKLPEPFNFKGTLNIRHNFISKKFHIFGKDISNNSESATIDISFDKINKILKVNLFAKIFDIKNINKYTLHYDKLDLSFLKLTEGKGELNLDLNKIKKKAKLKINFNLNNIKSNNQNIENIKGNIVSYSSIPSGNFIINDKKLKADIRFSKSNQKLYFKFNNIKAELNKVLKIIGFNLNIHGNSNGNFSLEKDLKTKKFTLKGILKSSKLSVFDYELNDYSSEIESNLKNIHIKDATFFYKNGIGKSDIFLNFNKKNFDIKGKINKFNLNKIGNGFKGYGFINFNGKGKFFHDPLNIDFELKNCSYYENRKFNLKAKITALTNFNDYRTIINGFIDYKSQKSDFIINLKKEKGFYSGDFKTKLKNPDLLMPWPNNKGTIDITGNIYSKRAESMNFKGIARFSGKQLVIPSFPHTIKDFKGYLIFNDLVFNLRNLTGKLGNGDIVSSGIIKINNGKLSKLSINFTGSKMKIYPMDRFTCTLDSTINMKLTKRNRILLKGNMNFSSVVWSREINEPIEFNTNASITPSESKLLKMIDFDLNLKGDKDIQMINSFGKVKGKFNLRLLGSQSFPVLLGIIEGTQGEIYFSDKEFKILKAKVFFNNRQFINPIVDIDSEAFIKNYRIRFRINGTASHPKPQFTSTPPLPPQDILALLSLGELYNRASSTEIRSQIGTTSLLSSQLIEQIKSRAKKLFGIDILKFDPYIKGTSLEQDVSRITIGKAISKDLIVVYSTNISTLQKDIIYLQYNLSPMISIIGMRNEDGRFSIDIRFRKRNK